MVKNKKGIRPFNIGGENYIVTYRQIWSTGWIMAYVAQKKHLTAIVKNANIKVEKTKKNMIENFLIISLFFFLISILVLFIIFKKYFMNPLKGILAEIRKMGHGNFFLKMKKSNIVEIDELSSAFSLLSQELKNYIINLKKETMARQAVESEIQIAADIQKKILPKHTAEFNTEYFQIYADLKAAKNVSGDFYDFFYLDSDRVAILVGDVSGKGVSSAFFMSVNKVIIKSTAQQYPDCTPAQILKRTNEIVCKDNSAGMFATVFLGYYNFKTGELNYANAGHHGAIIITKDGHYDEFGIMNNIALGCLPEAIYNYNKINIDIDSTIILYTDGAFECISPEGIEYGKERIKDFLIANRNKAMNNIYDIIINDITDFEQGRQFDDITMLFLRCSKIYPEISAV
jgi:phosphoserine phosphatase RsbU/P